MCPLQKKKEIIIKKRKKKIQDGAQGKRNFDYKYTRDTGIKVLANIYKSTIIFMF